VSRLKRLIETTPLLLGLKFAFLKPLHWLMYTIKRNPNEIHTATRGAVGIVSSPEYDHIPKHPDAGLCKGGYLVMHNGVRVLPTCYIGWQNYAMLRASKGVHEPEEERVFMNVLTTMKPGATMVELGAYWAFYSLWFQQAVPNARSVLVEPMLSNLNYGRKNFLINSRRGEFVHAFVGAEESSGECGRTVTVDSLIRDHGITAIDILHADIQGVERRMLMGGRTAFQAGIIKWVFISTHSEQLHNDCRDELSRHGYVMVAEAQASEIDGPDGVLVMRHHTVPDPEISPILLRRCVNGA
jgi:hypothetical protein